MRSSVLRTPLGKRLAGTAIAVACGLVAAWYLAQNWRATPSAADDGLILDYIHQMALGRRPHFDMVDAYGVVNWIFPVAFYKLAGQKIWAIRLWLVALKLLGVGLSYRTVASLTNRLYGALAAIGLTLLLGQPWQALQTAYAFLTVVPLVLGAWHVLVTHPFRRAWLNPAVAAALTTLTLWTKLNTGLYLFAGGLMTLAFWAPRGAREATASRAAAVWLLRLRIAFALALFGALSAYVAGHFDMLYVYYLVAPLALAVMAALFATERPSPRTARSQWRSLGIYCAATAVLSSAILFGYYGLGGAIDYAHELSSVFGVLRYQTPFPPLGKPIIYVGLNENYWLQLPWLLTGLFAVWLVLERWLGRRTGTTASPEQRHATHAIFLLTTLNCFVLFPRSDDMHLFQALLLVVPALLVIVARVDGLLRERHLRAGVYFREIILVLAALYASTIAVRPSLDIFELATGDYGNPRFEYLQYRPRNNPYIRGFDAHITDHEWDAMLDAAARYIDSITDENEPILVMGDQRLIHSLSSTTSVGGRYAFQFYLVSTGLLDRKGFDNTVPKDVLESILDHPPRVIVSIDDRDPMARAFPELLSLRRQRYVRTRVFRYVRVYELKPAPAWSSALALTRGYGASVNWTR